MQQAVLQFMAVILPTTPWTKNKDGRGPAWSNSLFEDNAEFGFGFRLINR